VRGKNKIHERGSRRDLLKSERVGRGGGRRGDAEGGKSSPRRHWPQKAATAHAATAASKGELRSRLSTSCESILALIGGRGGRFELSGARLRTPFN
jgi:hypothetical protein